MNGQDNGKRSAMGGPPKRVAVVGAGLIGASWAALFSAYGYEVSVFDPDERVQDRFFGRVAAAKRDLACLMDPADAAIEFSSSLAGALDSVSVVQECGPEDLSRKRDLLATILSLTSSMTDVPIATSTSSLTHGAMTDGLDEADRVAIGHPFNPPHLVPLVEVFAVRDSVAAILMDFYRSVGREPVRLARSLPGHGANRLASALWREAVHLVAEGVADVDAVDRMLVKGPGFRWRVMGPFMTYHLGGGDGGLGAYLDHLGDSQESRWAALGNPRLDSETRKRLVAGMKQVVDGKTVAMLAAERDRRFVEILRDRTTLSALPATATEPDPPPVIVTACEGSITVRRACPEDVHDIARLIGALAAYEGKPFSTPLASETVHDWLFGPCPDLHVLVALRSEIMVGYLAWFRGFSPFKGGPTLMIENIFVDDDHRGQGVGRALIQGAAREAQAHNIDRLELTVRAGNAPAQKAYERLGFRSTAEEVLRLDGISSQTGPKTRHTR